MLFSFSSYDTRGHVLVVHFIDKSGLVGFPVGICLTLDHGTKKDAYGNGFFLF